MDESLLYTVLLDQQEEKEQATFEGFVERKEANLFEW